MLRRLVHFGCVLLAIVAFSSCGCSQRLPDATPPAAPAEPAADQPADEPADEPIEPAADQPGDDAAGEDAAKPAVGEEAAEPEDPPELDPEARKGRAGRTVGKVLQRMAEEKKEDSGTEEPAKQE